MAGALFSYGLTEPVQFRHSFKNGSYSISYYKVLLMGQKIGGKENERKCSNSGTAKCTG